MKNVLIGMPCYGGNLQADTLHSIIGIESAKDVGLLNYSVMTVTNESLITRARNTILSTFYHNKEFTHLFFVDSDLGFPKETLPLLLNTEEDVIGIPVPLKGFSNNNLVYNIGKIYSHENNILDLEHIGTALFMLSRKAVESLVNSSEKYLPSKLTRGQKSTDWQYDVFQVGVENGIYLSEDYYVCHKLRKLGYKIKALSNIPVKHNGMYTFGE